MFSPGSPGSIPAKMKQVIEQFRVVAEASFPSVDAFQLLAEKYRGRPGVTLLEGARSRQGKPLVAFVIGNGERVVGVTSGAHADEPIGVLTSYNLIQGLVEDERFAGLLKRYTFVCHPLVDPDGYELNSAWFSNPLKFSSYYLDNFRNNHIAEDCEHGIPFQAGQAARPEMLFVKENLDKFRGRFEYYVTLHSSHILPGACFVFDRDHRDEELRAAITELCGAYQLPLMDYKIKGDETMAYLGPGFIGAPNVAQVLERYKDQPEILAKVKMTTYEYAQVVCGAKSAFISELPIWVSEANANYADSSMSMNELKARELEFHREYHAGLVRLEGELSSVRPSEENPWYRAFLESLKRIATHIAGEEAKAGSYEGYAQELEVYELGNQATENAARLLKFAIKSVEGIPAAEAFRQENLAEFFRVIAEYERNMQLRQLSIKTQVEIQLGLIFSAIPELRG